jgi:hypothetical protein
MTLAGVQAHHSWVDSRMRVTGYAPLQSETAWRESRLLLGAAVHKVVEEFQVRPPEIVRILDPNLNNIQRRKTSTSSSLTNSNSDAPPDYAAVLHTTPALPPIPTQFDAELNALDREALDVLLHDELEFQAFCNKLSTLQTLHSMSNSILEQNIQTAEQNLSHQEELLELHKHATDLQNQLKRAVHDFGELEIKQDKLCRPPDRRKLIRELNKAKREAFERSERLAEEWLENDAVHVDDFVREFLQVRRTHHERAAKLELVERTTS